ncbi:MAG: RNA polymerase sigma factor [Armatimonas sp.]
MTDETLMHQAATGDTGAFDQLVGRHRTGLIRYARRFVGSEALAEEVAQEALLKLWVARGNYRSGSATFTTYLYTITRRLTIDAHRQRQVELPLPGYNSPEAQVLAREQETQLWKALESLPETLRAPLTLQLREELSYEELAARLELSVTTLKARLHRARKSLQKDFPDLFPEKKEKTTMNEKKIMEELASLRQEVNQLKTVHEENPLETFFKQHEQDFRTELIARGNANGIGVGTITLEVCADRKSSRWGVNYVTRDSLTDITDDELKRKATYLQAVADPLALKVLQEFARRYYAGESRHATQDELCAALGEEIDPVLVRLKEAGILTEPSEQTLAWEGMDFATMLLLGVY